MRGMPETIGCKILMLIWPFGAQCVAPEGTHLTPEATSPASKKKRKSLASKHQPVSAQISQKP